MKVVLSRRARAELIAQIDWLEERSPSAALQAADAIRTALKTLGAFPRVGRILEDNQRSWPIRFGRDGFVAIYRIEPDQVIIARIFHSRQDR